MANSTISISFTETALITNDLLDTVCQFTFISSGTVNVIETFKPFRSTSFQSGLNNDRVVNLYNSILIDYPNLFDAYIDGTDTVVIVALSPNVSFTQTTPNALLIYQINNVVDPTVNVINVYGISSDRYLINNEINIDIASTVSTLRFRTVVTNLNTGVSSTNLISYPDAKQTATIGLQSIIKSLFTYPADADGYIVPYRIVGNANKFKISIYYTKADIDGNPDGEFLGFETIKTFVRGGDRNTTLTNRTLGLSLLNITDKLPVWEGYDTAEYYFDQANNIRKNLLSDVDPATITYLRSKGCNEVYVKFLNQNGGYSNWLFESYTDTYSSSNEGGFIKDNKVNDLGNNAVFTRQLESKVPKQFIEIILQLIISPEIWITIEGETVRVRSGSNKQDYDNIRRGYPAKVNLLIPIRFNPSLLWAN